MNCKSCKSEIKAADSYCPNCGGKTVTERLTLKGTWTEFIGPFFSWDNNFGKTFIGLFTKPQDILNAYINGARKKYFKPFPFIIVYATIALFFYKFFPFTDAMIIADQNSNESLSENMALTTKVMEFIFEYFNFFTIIAIPIFAFISYLALKKYKNNYAEHLVIQSYLQAIAGHINIILQIILMLLLKPNASLFGILTFSSSIIYCNYAFTKFYKWSFKSALIANLKFFGLAMLAYIIIGILIIAITVVIQLFK